MFPNNEIIYTDDKFYVSYLLKRNEFARVCDELVSAVNNIPSHPDCDETALCVRTSEPRLHSVNFYILYGDHREEYRKLVPDLDACITYFLSHQDLIGCSSDKIGGFDANQ
jgi:hypothetical protein